MRTFRKLLLYKYAYYYLGSGQNALQTCLSAFDSRKILEYRAREIYFIYLLHVYIMAAAMIEWKSATVSLGITRLSPATVVDLTITFWYVCDRILVLKSRFHGETGR